MTPDKVDTFVSLINGLGILAFAFSGALAGMRKEADIVGVLILSIIACSCGGAGAGHPHWRPAPGAAAE